MSIIDVRDRICAGLLAAALASVPVMAAELPPSSAEPAPTLTSTPAPGQGVIAGISEHSAAMPELYALQQQKVETISPLISRQYISGAHSTFVRWIVKKGAVFPLHHHAAEQITWITEGRCEVFSNGRKFVMEAGDVMVIPPNTPHEFHCTEDTIDIDIFSPQRQDWIDGTANYLNDPVK